MLIRSRSHFSKMLTNNRPTDLPQRQNGYLIYPVLPYTNWCIKRKRLILIFNNNKNIGHSVRLEDKSSNQDCATFQLPVPLQLQQLLHVQFWDTHPHWRQSNAHGHSRYYSTCWLVYQLFNFFNTLYVCLIKTCDLFCPAAKASGELEHQEPAGHFASLVVYQFGKSVRSDFLLCLRWHHIRGDDQRIHCLGHTRQQTAFLLN